MRKRMFCLLIIGVLFITSFQERIFADDTVVNVNSDNFIETINNANNESKIILNLTSDIYLYDYLRVDSGNITINGNGFTIILGEDNTESILVSNDAILNLKGGESTLMIKSSGGTGALIIVSGYAKLNIYEGTILGPNNGTGQAGAVDAIDNSTVNMYGGLITKCTSLSSAGGVHISNNATFNMYDGTISECTGTVGGGVGLNGRKEIVIGPSSDPQINNTNATFNMHDGTISNCKDTFSGGGGVHVDLLHEEESARFEMNGGILKECSTVGSGGAVYIGTSQSSSSSIGNGEIKINNGTITNNSADKYGGGVYVQYGDVQISSSAPIYNNKASVAGDDMYTGSVAIDLGSDIIINEDIVWYNTDEYFLADCKHMIDGWYFDKKDNRYSCTGKNTKFMNTKLQKGSGLKAAHGEYLTVTFMWGEENDEIYLIQSVIKGDYVKEPIQPSREGYEFAGWFEDKDFNKEYKFWNGTGYMLRDDLILYSKWNKVEQEEPNEGIEKPEESTPPHIDGQDPSLPEDDLCESKFGSGWVWSENQNACIRQEWVIVDTSTK